MDRDFPHDDTTADTAERILAVAERLFGQRGYSDVSIRDIARAAGISKANVFHHYASKQALYEAVLERSASRFHALLESLADHQREAAELLEDFSRRHLRNMLERQDALSLYVRHLLDAASEDQGTAAEAILERTYDVLVERFAALQRQGKLAGHADPGVLALTLVGSHLVYVLGRKVLQQRAVPAAERFSKTLIRQLLDGVAAGPRAGGQDQSDRQ